MPLYAQFAAVARPATQPAECLVGEMHIQRIPAINYFYGSAETTFAQLPETTGRIMPDIIKSQEEGKVRSVGPDLFVYRGLTGDMGKPFTLEMGFPVAEDAKAFGNFRIRKLDPVRCATILYTGPTARISKAYEKLMPAIFAAGLKPTGESREFYLYWENPDSLNNVVQIQVGIE
jgi:effector-binding domain-containing protein